MEEVTVQVVNDQDILKLEPYICYHGLLFFAIVLTRIINLITCIVALVVIICFPCLLQKTSVFYQRLHQAIQVRSKFNSLEVGNARGTCYFQGVKATLQQVELKSKTLDEPILKVKVTPFPNVIFHFAQLKELVLLLAS